MTEPIIIDVPDFGLSPTEQAFPIIEALHVFTVLAAMIYGVPLSALADSAESHSGLKTIEVLREIAID